jgi:urease accessory protein
MIATAKATFGEFAPALSGASRVRAAMQLDFAHDAARNITFLAASSQEAPLKAIRAFTLEDGTALIHLHNVSGGLLGGDQLTLKIDVGREAFAQIATTGATRVYRHRRGFSPTTQCNHFAVGEGALLEYVPDATIPFAGANYMQRTSIELAKCAGLFWWEILAPGREASGELFQYDQFEMRTCVRACGRKIVEENICLRPASCKISSIARLGPFRYVATFYICRAGLDPSTWRSAEDYLRRFTTELTRPGEILWGVSSLAADGLVVKCLALRGHQVLPGLQALWREAKLFLYGRVAIPPRKVN